MGIENRGFASMDPERRREIARRGGQTAHRIGRAHRWTSEEARAAARMRQTGRHTEAPTEDVQTGDVQTDDSPGGEVATGREPNASVTP